MSSGGLTTLIFIADAADAVSSFVTRSEASWNMYEPFDGVQTFADTDVASLEVLERSHVDPAGRKLGWNNTSA